MARKVRALRPFYDLKEGVNRQAGEVFDVTPARMAELNACGVEQGRAELVREVDEEKPAGRKGGRKAAGE